MAKVEEKLDWLKLKQEIKSEEVTVSEGGIDKLLRKSKENPLVPLGAAATVGCLAMGLRSFNRGEARKSQLLMRGRVLAQGFTVLALVGGIILSAYKKHNQEG